MIRQANEQKNMGPQCHKSPAWRILASALVFSIIGASGVTWGMTHLKRTLPFAQQFLNSNKLDWTIGTANKDQLFFKNSSAFGGPELYKKNHEASRPGWFGIPSDLGGGMGNEKDGSLPKHAPSLNSLQPGNSFDKNVLFKPIKPIAFSEEDFVKELLYGGKISAKRIRCAIEKSLKNAPDGFSYHLGTAISFVIDAINKQLEKAAKDNQEKVVENKELKDKLEEYKSLLEQINEAKQAPNQQREVAVGTEPLDMKKQLAVENNLAKARLEIEKLRRLLGTVQEEKNSVTQNLHTANQVITSLKNQLSAQEDAHRNELNRRESIFQQDKELLKRRLTEQELRFKEFEQKSMQRAKEEAAALRTSLEEQAQQLQEQTEKGRVAIGAKDAEIGALKGKITDLTGRLAAETGRAKQKDLDVKGLSGIVKKKDGEIKKKDDEIKKRDDDIKKKDDEIKKRDDGIKKKNMEIGILTERIKDIPKQIDDIVHTKTEDLIKKNDELNKKLENSEKMRNDSRKKYFDLRLRLEKLKKRTSKLNEKLERD
ncbi:MAG: hypothetical protein M1549_03540 [Candidatus Dependentiae bacterium]|nr:hypothetical protein [Candidatus Dependentiae bacterium]